MKYLMTLMFVLLSTQLWATGEKQTYLCLSSSDNSQKLLVLADVNGEQIGYLETDKYKLNDENGVLVGSFSLSLILRWGMWTWLLAVSGRVKEQVIEVVEIVIFWRFFISFKNIYNKWIYKMLY